MEEISILEYSACGNKQSAQKLKFKGNQDLRIIYSLKKMLEKKSWDLISVRDITYHSLKHLEPELMAMGYRMIIDPTWKTVKEKEKWRYTCLSVLFVKNTIKCSQIVERYSFETVLRYVCISFEYNGHNIYFRTSHIPCVDATRFRLSKQVERKEKMLRADIDFQNKHKHDCALCSGDYNGAVDEEDCYCRELYDEFIFDDLISEGTYEGHKLDHCYVSESFKEKGIAVDAEILDDYYMQFTDHKMLSITLKAI